jgi:hypothetical protein
LEKIFVRAFRCNFGHVRLSSALLGWILSTFSSRKDLVLENFALRQQLLALHTKQPPSPTCDDTEIILGSSQETVVRMAEASSVACQREPDIVGLMPLANDRW